MSVSSRRSSSYNSGTAHLDSSRSTISSETIAERRANNNTHSSVEEAAPPGGAKSPVILDYPRDFFPKPWNVAKAEDKWKWRKKRPAYDQDETERVDGIKMLAECQAIKDSLREFAIGSYGTCSIAQAGLMGLRLADINMAPVTSNDLKTVISKLEASQRNYQLFYDIFYKKQHDRQFAAEIIDKWLKLNNMKLLPPSEDEKEAKKRMNHYDRGCFTAVVREAKSQAARRYTKHLLRQQGWKVVTTGPKMTEDEKLNKSNTLIRDGYTYEKYVPEGQENRQHSKKENYWVVKKVTYKAKLNTLFSSVVIYSSLNAFVCFTGALEY